jgi:RHS repeat-associated protein
LPLTRTDSAYDAHRNPVREAVSANGTTYGLTERSFDDRGRLVCQAQRMNISLFGATTDACQLAQPEGSQGPDRITHNIYDSAGQLLQVQRAYLTPLQQNYATYEYTPNGKQKAVIDANRNRSEMTYDGFDRPRRWIFPSPTPPPPGQAGVVNPADYEEYGYDAEGNRTSLRKRDGVTLLYQYDNLDRLRIKTVPTSATQAAGYSVYYGYDVRGLQAWARFGSDSGPGVATQYDGFGRVVASATSVDGTARTLTSTYDAASNRIGLAGDPGAWGYISAFSFDSAGRPTGLIENGHPIVQIGYDPVGRRSSLGLGFDTFPSSAAYQYDAVGRLQNLTHHLAGNGNVNDEALTFDYNPAGQIVRRTSSNNAYASNTALAVDRTYGVNGLNQYTGTISGGTPSAAFQYDANGNLISDGSNAYVYDAENRLVSATGAHTATLSYDPLGRLWQVASPSGTTRFLYDGDRLVLEYDAAGTVLRAYDHGTGPDEPLVWYEAVPGGVSRRYLHADHQGSIIAIADQNGNPIAINAYDAWGIPNAGNLGRFGYTGQAWLPELGMWYYKARIYSPTLGRFLQTDPVGYQGGIDLYAYVDGDPVSRSDSTGLAPNKDGATDWVAVEDALRSKGLGGLAGNTSNNGRYFYTETYGWVDVRHFGTAATDVQRGTAGWAEKTMGFGVEVNQWLNEGKDDYQSGFSPEDLPSNSAGVSFGQMLRDHPRKAVDRVFKVWAWRNGARTRGSDEYGSALSQLPKTDPSERGGTNRGSNTSSARPATPANDNNGGNNNNRSSSIPGSTCSGRYAGSCGSGFTIIW